MRITKREHATLVISEGDERLVIDPGKLTAPLTDVEAVVAVVLTHEHPDHWSADHLTDLRERFGDIPLYGPAGVATAVGDDLPGAPLRVVAPGDSVTAGEFRLSFHGGQHAQIHSTIPLIENVGVLVNERFYYGGDAYDGPGVPVEVLAAPLSAPWLRIGDVLDYVAAVAPRHTFGTHDALYTPLGLGIVHPLLSKAAERVGGTHHRLDAGESLEV